MNYIQLGFVNHFQDYTLIKLQHFLIHILLATSITVSALDDHMKALSYLAHLTLSFVQQVLRCRLRRGHVPSLQVAKA